MVIRKRILKILGLLLVMLIIYQALTLILIRNSVTSEYHVRSFYKEPKNTLDVAVIGCSEVYADFSPPIAYQQSGFTSYNFAFSGTPPCFYKSMLMEFCKTQKPQAVVFEVNGFFYTEQFALTEANMRNWLDNIKPSTQWASDIMEYVPEEQRFDYFVPLSKYHDNWQRPEGQFQRLKTLAKVFTSDEGSLMKSFGTRTTNNSRIHTFKKRALRLTDFGRKCLLELMDYCKEQGIENVLFIRAPHRQKLASATSAELEKVITDAGFDFIDCDKISDQIGMVDKDDYYNEDHMNVFGNEKFTRYLSNYLVDKYDIKPDHSEETEKHWQKCVDYTNDAFEILKERTLANEDLPYDEYTDLGEENHQKMLKAAQEKIAKAAALKKEAANNAKRVYQSPT